MHAVIALSMASSMMACHRRSPPETKKTAASASSAATSAAPGSSAPAPAARATTTGDLGDATTLKLRSGAILQLPPGAKAETNAKPLPPEVENVHIFSWKEPRRLLAITEHVPEPDRPCKARLAHQWQGMQRSKSDTDAARLNLRRMGNLEQLTVKGRRVLYSDSMRRGIAGQEQNRPFAATAMAVMCEGSDYVAMIYTIKAPELPPATKKMLLDITASYTPPAP